MKKAAVLALLALMTIPAFAGSASAWANKKSMAAMLRERDYICEYCEYVQGRGRDHDGIRTFLVGCGGQENILKYEVKFVPGQDIEVAPVY